MDEETKSNDEIIGEESEQDAAKDATETPATEEEATPAGVAEGRDLEPSEETEEDTE